MKRHFRYLLMILFCVFAPSLYAASPDSISPEVEKMMTQAMKEYHIPGVAVELYQNGTAYSYYAGYANTAKKMPVTHRTIFEIGSVSKIMTSLLFAQEIDMANMGLTDTLNKYVPHLSDDLAGVTLQDLATHTAGLPLSHSSQAPQTSSAWQQYFTSASLETDPGEQWTYSHIGFSLLEQALENETHKNFDDLYRRHILNPLKMMPIGTKVPRAFQKFYAQGYDKKGLPVSSLVITALASSSSIKASAQDMQRFLSAAIGLPGTPERVFYPMRLTQTAFIKLADRMQGLGWQIAPISSERSPSLFQTTSPALSMKVEEVYDRPVYNGDMLIDISGGTQGFRAYIALVPNKKSGIVILVNKALPRYVLINLGRQLLLKATGLA